MAALCSPAKQLASGRSFVEAPTSGSFRLSSAPSSSSSSSSSSISSSSSSVRCVSAAAAVSTQSSPAGLLQLHQGVQSGALQCPTAPPPPRTFGGDWNSRMIFNRGVESVKAVDKDSLWSALEAAGDKPVVLDMYSRWCGPCRLIYPKVVKLSDEYDDVVFLKLDCSSENKTVFSKLGIGILPTFKIFKNSSLVSEVKGAKYDELVSKIEHARAS